MPRWPYQRLAIAGFVAVGVAWPVVNPVLAQSSSAGAASASDGPMAILVRNPDTSDGKPPYALADEFGRVQRLVEPSPGVRLAPYVGKTVRIRHDTGAVLLGSQLELPRIAPGRRESASSSEELRPVSPAQFVPPRKVARLEDAISAEDPEQRYVVVPAQLVDRLVDDADRYTVPTDEDPAEPIDLDQLLADEAEDPDLSDDAYADDLPQPERVTPEPIPSAEVLPEYTVEDLAGVSSTHSADCPHCQGSSPPTHAGYGSGCPDCQSPQGWCGPTCKPASRRGVYGRAEYLLWVFDGMDTPPLATTNTLGGSPILGVAGTEVVYGGDLLDDSRNGLRFTLGGWLDENRDLGLEVSWTNFETESDVYRFTDPSGASILGRPFYNPSPDDGMGGLLPPAEDARLISFPGTVAGSLDITARSRFRMGGLLLRTGLCCREIGGGPVGGGLLRLRKGSRPKAISRVDFLVGYRHADLEEELIFDDTATTTATGETVSILEGFEVDNDFHGLDLGVSYEWLSRRWGLELLSKIALGNNRQRVRIFGTNTVSTAGAPGVTTEGGLLAQSSNIGVRSRDQFSVVPELSARLSYRISERISLSAAYTLVYWANVVRPGDHIDYTTLAGTAHPRFDWDETNFWAHGLNLGAEFNY